MSVSQPLWTVELSSAKAGTAKSMINKHVDAANEIDSNLLAHELDTSTIETLGALVLKKHP